MNDVFNVLAVADLSENKQLVLSKHTQNNNYVFAKRYKVTEGEKSRYFYEKGSTIIEPDILEDFIKKISEKL